MQITRSYFVATFLVFVLLLCAGDIYSRPRTRSRRTAKKTTRTVAPSEDNQPASPFHVRLLLVDGSRQDVDEAWESEQGIWYKKNGVSYLSPRERVKSIERGDMSGPSGTSQTPKLTTIATPDESSKPTAERTWIHLKGGARMEADPIEDSAAVER